MPTYEKELEAGLRIARQAGDRALEYRGGDIGIESKADESPVTIADRECEKLIVQGLTEAFPQDGLLGEEGATRESTNGRKWIIDPIDGTRDFIRGTRAWSVLIGLEEHGEIVAGFAYYPAMGEMFWASKGNGAFWLSTEGERRIQISDKKTKAEALLCLNGFSLLPKYAFAEVLVPWLAGFWTVRSMGGCVDATLVASGRADVWIETQAKPWDLAPLAIIAKEAGATTFDFAGKDTIYGGNYVITVPPLADEVLRFVSSRSEPK
jgi:histidinol-phosphatase